jgi:hypothetical protein
VRGLRYSAAISMRRMSVATCKSAHIAAFSDKPFGNTPRSVVRMLHMQLVDPPPAVAMGMLPNAVQL